MWRKLRTTNHQYRRLSSTACTRVNTLLLANITFTPLRDLFPSKHHETQEIFRRIYEPQSYRASMAAEVLPQNFSLDTITTQPVGPIFIDDEECTCALQEALGTEAWRCVTNSTSEVYSGQTGKWFFAINQTDIASLRDSPNSDSNPPNTSMSYVIEGEGRNAKFKEMNSSSITTDSSNITTDLGYVRCSGNNNTEDSSDFYRVMAMPSVMAFSVPCWQPGVIPLVMQNQSAWNATGCNLGFFCNCANPNVLRNPPS